jgi:hypothetical protein
MKKAKSKSRESQESSGGIMRTRFMRPLLLAVGMLLMAAASAFAQVSISVAVAPPELPVYEQPLCPSEGYIWTPGYWAWDGDDYYWVPGTWIEPPEVGFLWTPGYWGWGGSAFLFHAGYWGPTIGFYGGVNYGFGYFGHGFDGGRWEGGHFFYNRAVANVNVTVIHNVYETRVNETRVTRVSYNGGRGGIEARASREEEAAEHERHVGAVEAQTRHVEEARSNRELRASVNHGKPPIAATARPGEFKGGDAGAAREGDHRATTAVHPKELPPTERHAAPNSGNPKVDTKYQQQQQKLSTRQDQERQKLQQTQDQEHQKMQQQKANDDRQRQVEQKHQQQTEQLQQRHTQQQQKLEQHQQPAHQAAAPKEKK